MLVYQRVLPNHSTLDMQKQINGGEKRIALCLLRFQPRLIADCVKEMLMITIWSPHRAQGDGLGHDMWENLEKVRAGEVE